MSGFNISSGKQSNCESVCDIRSCLKRHPRYCKFFRRKRCKFDDECLFKHEVEEQINDTENVLQRENKELKNEIKALNAALEKMKKEVDQKNDIIKKKDENIEKLSNAYSNLEADNIVLKKSNEANNKKCPVCEDNFDDLFVYKSR